MLPEANYYTPDADIAWLVRQFEFIRYDGSNELTDKFVPREDAAIVFNFRNLPRMASPVSKRTLQRRFCNRLGTTPKMLVRIIRINRIWDAITAGEKIDYHDLVYLGNYFDQTYMIKDFKSITGETPDAFFRRNLGIARIMSGK